MVPHECGNNGKWHHEAADWSWVSLTGLMAAALSSAAPSLSSSIPELHFTTCYAPKTQTEDKRRGNAPPPDAHPAASLARWVVLVLCQFNSGKAEWGAPGCAVTRELLLLHKPSSSNTSAQTYAQRRGAVARPYFYCNIKILNDCSAPGIWRGLNVNHRRRKAAFRLDDCARPTLLHCDAAAAIATSVLLEVMGCELLVRGPDKM